MSLDTIRQYRKEADTGYAAGYKSHHSLILTLNGGIIYLVLKYTEIILTASKEMETSILDWLQWVAIGSLALICLVLINVQLGIGANKHASESSWLDEHIFIVDTKLSTNDFKSGETKETIENKKKQLELDYTQSQKKMNAYGNTYRVIHFFIWFLSIANAGFIGYIISTFF